MLLLQYRHIFSNSWMFLMDISLREICNSNCWIRNLFLFQLCAILEDDPLKEEFIDDSAKKTFKLKTLEKFGASQVAAFPSNSKKAYGFTSLGKQVFPIFFMSKSSFKTISILSMSYALLSAEKNPSISNIIEKKQGQ